MGLGPSLLSAVLLIEVGYLILTGNGPPEMTVVRPKDVSESLYGPYLIGLELASMLLLPGLIGAYHMGRRLPGEQA